MSLTSVEVKDTSSAPLGTRYDPTLRHPRGLLMTISGCLTFDFDGISSWAGSVRRTRSPNLLARGEFGAVGAERLLDLLRDRQLPSTWFTPGHTIDTWPDLCERIADAGHELAYHGYCHEAPSSKRDEADERAILERGIACIERVRGRPPVGSRNPGGNLGPRWVDLLLEYGFSLRLLDGAARLPADVGAQGRHRPHGRPACVRRAGRCEHT